MTLKRKNPGIAPDVFYDLNFCPIRSIHSKLSSKWTILVLTHLSFGTHRFSELLAAIPDISQRMLTKSLRTLESAGMVSRKVTPSVPPRVDYSVTKFGYSYLKELDGLLQWSLKNRSKIEANQKAYDNQ